MFAFLNRSICAACLGLVLGLLSGCATPSGSASSSSGDERVRRGRLERRLVLDGSLAAVREQAVLVPRQAAWRHPIRWMVEDGARVEEGDVVLEFDNQQAIQQREEAELRVVSAINALVARESSGAGEVADKRVDLARKRAARDKAALDAKIPKEMRRLREWQEMQLTLQQAETALLKAQDDLTAALAGLAADVEVEKLNLSKAERDRDEALDAIDQLSLKAPASGIALIGDHPWEGRRLQLGDTAYAGLAVVKIPDLSRMRVEAYLSDVDDGLVLPGMSVDCVLDAHPESHHAGIVSSVSPVATTPASTRSLRRSFRVSVDLLDADPAEMIPGMSVRLDVEVEALDDVLLAPRSALARSGESWRARLRDGGWAEVDLGPCDAFDCLVLGGLDEGRSLGRADEEGSS